MPPSKVPGTNAVQSVPGTAGTKGRVGVACIPGAGVAGLKIYVGKSVEAFCPFGYGRDADTQNHCAHFVSHALNIQVGTLCTGLLPWRVGAKDPLFRGSTRGNRAAGMFTGEGEELSDFKGATVRVNDLYNSIDPGEKGDWDSRPDPAADCLMFVTTPKNISKDRGTMGENSRKHVGIHTGGVVYNYGNTKDAVVDDLVEAFIKKFRHNYGADSIFLWAKVPDTTGFCVHAG